jgi:hypothetical protein
MILRYCTPKTNDKSISGFIDLAIIQKWPSSVRHPTLVTHVPLLPCLTPRSFEI